jgi:hypothetical protein
LQDGRERVKLEGLEREVEKLEYPDSISPQELLKFIKNNDWIIIHRLRIQSIVEELKSLSVKWNDDRPTILEEHFLPLLEPSEKETLRERIRAWWLLAWQKHLWSLQSRFLIAREERSDLMTWSDEIENFRKWPGPQEDEVVRKMTSKELRDWANANFTASALQAKSAGMTSINVSERFFAFEALAKSLCSASCIQFLYKVINPDTVIKHDEVLKALKQLGLDKKKNSVCRVCRFQSCCQGRPEFGAFARAYIALMHIRMIRDYREEYILDSKIQSYFIGEFFDLSQELIFLMEEFNDMAFGHFLTRPISFRQEEMWLKKLMTDKVSSH